MARYVPEAGDFVWLNFMPQTRHKQAGHRWAVVLTRLRIMTSRARGELFFRSTVPQAIACYLKLARQIASEQIPTVGVLRRPVLIMSFGDEAIRRFEINSRKPCGLVRRQLLKLISGGGTSSPLPMKISHDCC
jgi:hypothetical protein